VELTLTTPGLLFPTVSLLLLAYTNRFVVLANLIRDLHARYRDRPDDTIPEQIASLRRRVVMIRNMQAAGILSLFICVLCMLLLFAGQIMWGEITFGISLALLLVSLGISLAEIGISVQALDLQLTDCEQHRLPDSATEKT
jgi:hypothetical protein